MAEIELASMTWKEAAAARDRGAVVLIPIGTLEQNGSISPLASDTYIADEVARRVAETAGAVVAPTLNYGYSPQFRHFPGTVCLRPDTLRALIFDVCHNLIENGFKRLVLVNCHNFTEPIMEHAARDVREQLGILLGFMNPIHVAQAASQDLYAGKEATLGHGAEPIASMLRAFVPQVVKPEVADSQGWEPFQGLQPVALSKVKVGGGVFGLYFDSQEISGTGGAGDPTASDPDRGAEIMRRVIEQSVAYVRAFARLDVTIHKKEVL